MSAAWDGHICEIPLRSRKHWWTCPDCGQVWRKTEGNWKLTPREATA